MANEKNEAKGQDGERFVVVPGGLTEKEYECIMHLAAAWNKFVALDKGEEQNSQVLQNRSAFLHGLHSIQRIVGMRVLKREYPEFWKGG